MKMKTKANKIKEESTTTTTTTIGKLMKNVYEISVTHSHECLCVCETKKQKDVMTHYPFNHIDQSVCLWLSNATWFYAPSLWTIIPNNTRHRHETAHKKGCGGNQSCGRIWSKYKIHFAWSNTFYTSLAPSLSLFTIRIICMHTFYISCTFFIAFSIELQHSN